MAAVPRPGRWLRAGGREGLIRLLSERPLFLLLLLAIIVVVNAALVPYFLTLGNLLSLTAYAVEIGLLALGEVVVIITGAGAIDLSVGSMVSFASMVFGLLLTRGHVPLWLGITLTLGFGVLMGSVNGLFVTVFRFPALIVTLATLYAYASVPLVLTNTVPISNLPSGLYRLTGSLAGVPTQVVVVFIPVVLVLGFVLHATVLGRYVYSIGINELAARFAAVPVRWTRFAAFCLSGLLAGLTAVVTTSRFASARPDAGMGMELQAITIAVLGGASIAGGSGTVAGVVLATLLVTVMDNAMNVAGLQSTWQLGALGALLIGSALLNQLVRQRFGTRRGRVG
jgi:ribose/xylose/arabinose/galactoside ABC-type transport system permease subunit